VFEVTMEKSENICYLLRTCADGNVVRDEALQGAFVDVLKGVYVC